MAETFLTVIIVTENTNTENGEVCFHPVVLVVTILLVGITIFLANRKPAKWQLLFRLSRHLPIVLLITHQKQEKQER